MSSMRGDGTKNTIKLAARRLFATRGIDGVSVREIATAASQRNSGSVHYYFRTKEALVTELVVDGAQLINERRNAMLDEAEHKGEIKHLRKIIEILLKSSIDLEADGSENDSYLRFINWLQTNHRQLFLDALDKKWNSGYQRCLAHIKQLLPKVPPQILTQRLIFMELYLNATLSAREAAFDDKKGAHYFWTASYTMENLIDSVQALLEGKPSVHTAREMTVKT
jgi:AcrR family transcriptional regulator